MGWYFSSILVFQRFNVNVVNVSFLVVFGLNYCTLVVGVGIFSFWDFGGYRIC